MAVPGNHACLQRAILGAGGRGWPESPQPLSGRRQTPASAGSLCCPMRTAAPWLADVLLCENQEVRHRHPAAWQIRASQVAPDAWPACPRDRGTLNLATCVMFQKPLRGSGQEDSGCQINQPGLVGFIMSTPPITAHLFVGPRSAWSVPA